MTISEAVKILDRIRERYGDVDLRADEGNGSLTEIKPKAIRVGSMDAPEGTHPDWTFGNGLVVVAVIDLTI